MFPIFKKLLKIMSSDTTFLYKCYDIKEMRRL